MLPCRLTLLDVRNVTLQYLKQRPYSMATAHKSRTSQRVSGAHLRPSTLSYRQLVKSRTSQGVSNTHSKPFTLSHRLLATQTTADEKIEEITELYATAKDEFEIAAEETEKMTVYAEDDRGAAREALTALQTAYKEIVEGQDRQLGDEVKRRAGHRLRELEEAVSAMEERARSQD